MSIKRNNRGTETTAPDYIPLILNHLVEHVKSTLGQTWGPSDKRMMKVGKSGAVQPKWMNMLAWAKVIMRGQRMLTQRKKGKVIYLVLTAMSLTHAKAISWARRKRTKRVKKIRKRDKTKKVHRLKDVIGYVRLSSNAQAAKSLRRIA